MTSPRPSRAWRRVAAPILALAGAACAAAGTPPAGQARSGPADRWVDSVLATMSLRERAAQMVWPQIFADFTPTTSAGWRRAEQLVREQRVGGFIVSIGSPMEMAVKLNDLQRLSAVPLLVGADFETGAGFRARGGHFLPNGIYLGGATVFPYQMAFGAARDTTLAYELGRITAVEGRALGVHFAFSPVLDVNNNPANPVIGARSFGEDPRLVAALGRATVRGLQQNGMVATAKHFPGHGDTDRNSHLAVTTVSASRARLDSVELLPFRAAIAEGVGAIMTFHGLLPALDTTPVPATLSRAVMTGVLRDQLGFRGLLVTDALDMNGVLANVRVNDRGQVVRGTYGTINSIGIAEAVKLAVLAGADVLLMPSDVPAAIDAVVAGVNERRFDASRIDASVRRLLLAKRQFALDRERTVDLARVRRVVGDTAHLAVAQRVADRSITLLKDSLNVVPLPRPPRRILSVTVARRTDLEAGVVFNAELRRGGHVVNELTIVPDDPAFDAARALRLADSAEIVVVGWYLGHSTTTASLAVPPAMAEVLRGYAQRVPATMLVTFSNPYLLQQVPYVPAYVVAWSPFPVSQRAAASALLGNTPITGQSPVTIPPLAAGFRGFVREGGAR